MSERDRSNFKLVVQKKKREKESYDYKFIKKRETDGFNLAIMMMKSQKKQKGVCERCRDIIYLKKLQRQLQVGEEEEEKSVCVCV